MIKEGCPPRTSPGITPPFGGLCPALGLVTVALLTLTPRPLRSVRLACLIHAANVHSEPGSNPSKWAAISPKRLAAPRLRVEEKIGRGVTRRPDRQKTIILPRRPSVEPPRDGSIVPLEREKLLHRPGVSAHACYPHRFSRNACSCLRRTTDHIVKKQFGYPRQLF